MLNENIQVYILVYFHSTAGETREYMLVQAGQNCLHNFLTMYSLKLRIDLFLLTVKYVAP